MKLKKNVSTSGLLFASVSAMLGSGWLFGPLYVAQTAGNAGILSWLIGGCMAMLLALTFAEIISALPISGGVATYTYITHGNLLGFTMAWVFWVSVVFAAPIEVQATILYLSHYFPEIIYKTDDGFGLTLHGYIVSVILMLSISIINAISAKFMSETNKLISYLKILLPIVILFAFFYYSYKNGFFKLKGDFAPNGIQGILFAISFSGIIYAFNGFQYGLVLAGETRKPQKSIPRAAIFSILITLCIYLLLQVAFLFAIPPEALNNGWATLSFSGDAGPIAGLAMLLGIFWLVEVIYIGAITSMLGAGIVQCSTSARSLYAMSASGYLPKWFSKLNRGRVPVRAIFFNFIVGMLLFILFPTLKLMIPFLSSTIILAFLVGPICLIGFRKNCDNLKKPFKLPYHNIIAFFSFYICSLMLFWVGSDILLKLCLIIVIGFAFFILTKMKEKSRDLDIKPALCFITYLIITTGLSYLGSFEKGLNIIPFGYDFFVVFIVSLLFFILFKKYTLTQRKSQKVLKDILNS